MAKEIKAVEVTVLKHAKKGLYKEYTKIAWEVSKQHCINEGWIEASDKEKEEYFKDKITSKQGGIEPEATKPAKKSTKKATPKNVIIKDAEEPAESSTDDKGK